jgi:hypothetical protein
VTRARAEEYRRLAQECLAAARSASTREIRAALTEKAAFWFRLAEEQDAEVASIGRSVPPIPAEDQPGLQQQQQNQQDEKE